MGLEKVGEPEEGKKRKLKWVHKTKIVLKNKKINKIKKKEKAKSDWVTLKKCVPDTKGLMCL